MSRRLPVVMLVAWSLWLATPEAQQPPVFTARTDGVRLHVAVTDRNRPVTGLSAADFTLRDNGVEQRLDLVSGVDRLAVAFALDQSESVAEGPLKEVRAAAFTVLEALVPKDSAALLLFSDRLNLRVLPTRDRAAIRIPMERAVSQPRTLTGMWDATIAAASLLAQDPGRPVVIVVTDGCDNASWLDPDRAIHWLGRSDVTVDYLWHGIWRGDVRGNFEGGDNCLGQDFIDKAADATDGRIFQTDHRDLTTLLRDRIKTLRSGCLLTYTPTGVKTGDGWHKLEVTLRKGVRGRVTTRPGYWQ